MARLRATPASTAPSPQTRPQARPQGISRAARTTEPANPHAERISSGELGRLAKNFYWTKTLIFDRPFAEAVLAYNTANHRVTRRKLDVLAHQMRSQA